MIKIIDFMREVRVELGRVVWPDFQTTLRLTVIVILVTVTVGFFVGGVDFVLTKALALLLQNNQ